MKPRRRQNAAASSSIAFTNRPGQALLLQLALALAVSGFGLPVHVVQKPLPLCVLLLFLWLPSKFELLAENTFFEVVLRVEQQGHLPLPRFANGHFHHVAGFV